MGNLVADRIGIDSDPELIRRQVLLDRERQMAAISNPQQQLAARLGGLLGGGIANIAQDRGFFEVNDPLLNKVSKIQSVYNDVASRIDPASNPQEFFKELSAAYTNAGLGKEALKAAQEAQKASTLNMETQLKEAQLYSTRPELLSQRIEDALKAGNEAEAMRLAQMNQRILEGKDLEKRKTEADIKRIESQTREVQERIASGKFDWKIINNAAGAPIGVQVIDKKTGKLSFEKVDPDVTKAFLDSLGGGSTTTTTGGAGNAKLPTQEEVNALAANAKLTTNQPRQPRGRMEQMELDKLEERKRLAALENTQRTSNLQQGRDYFAQINQTAQSLGLIPLGTSGYDLTFVNPATGQIVLGSTLVQGQ